MEGAKVCFLREIKLKGKTYLTIIKTYRVIRGKGRKVSE
jgi:hypothetical protein